MALHGLLDSTALTSPTASPAAGPPTVNVSSRRGLVIPQEQEQPNVSADEQAEYNLIVNNAYNLLYDNMPALLKGISGGGDPVTGLAQTVANTLSRLVNSAVRSGKKLSNDIVFHAGIELIEDLADLAKDSDIHDFTPDELESATYLSVEMYRSLQQESGNIDPNEAAGDLEELQRAEADGTLDQAFPGIRERFSDFRQEPPTAGPELPRSRTGLAR